jgi:hypothetical protein
MSRKRTIQKLLFAIIFLGILGFLLSPIIEAQNWKALPPYNTLWPLWPSVLSPKNAITGLPTPIVTNLSKSTVLPVQPGLTWNPSALYPYLLYNTPVGMAYYDPAQGVNLWPPSYLLNATTGLPNPLSLLLGYQYLAPTSAAWLSTNVHGPTGLKLPAGFSYCSASQHNHPVDSIGSGLSVRHQGP